MSIVSQQSPTPIVDNPEPVFPARIGLRWGALFWIPILLLVLLLAAILYHGSTANSKSIPILALAILASSMLVLLFAGRWWATRGLDVSEWTFLLAAIAQGLALLLSLSLATAVAMWADGVHLFERWSDFDPLLAGWGICSIWTLALGAVVVWRVRRAAKLAHQRRTSTPGDDTSSAGPNGAARSAATEKSDSASDALPAQKKGLRRFALAFISSFGLPLLLCAPFVMMLRYDASLRSKASTILASQIKTIDAQLVDIKDLNRVNANLLARKRIVEVLETYASQAADALGILSRWPSGVQLLEMETKDGRVMFALRCAPSGERAVLELLAQNGYRDLQIALRQRGADEIGQVTIEASLTRGDAE